MALALKLIMGPKGGDNSQRRTIIQGTAVFSGSYVAGGEAINWLTQPTNFEGGTVLLNTLSTAPLWVEFQQTSPATSTPVWYSLQYNYTSNKLQVFVTGTAAGGSAELTAGAYTTTLAAAGVTFQFKAEFLNEA